MRQKLFNNGLCAYDFLILTCQIHPIIRLIKVVNVAKGDIDLHGVFKLCYMHKKFWSFQLFASIFLFLMKLVIA